VVLLEHLVVVIRQEHEYVDEDLFVELFVGLYQQILRALVDRNQALTLVEL
tara:strand:+ start:573 stop:725 length:153 start_codon:yes stop_codon:yes gene_type:complete